MARRLRIQYPGARYHVINRGNLPPDVFAPCGATHAFLIALDEAAVPFGWQVHACVVRRNPSPLALAPPEPNLVQWAYQQSRYTHAGSPSQHRNRTPCRAMPGLQSTFATRLTRFHGQQGPGLQGRSKAPLVEDAPHLARVCDYLPLHPVRAGVVTADRVGK